MSKNSSKLEGYAELLFDTLFNILFMLSSFPSIDIASSNEVFPLLFAPTIIFI